MGTVIKPIMSYKKTKSGKTLVWFDYTINQILKRVKMAEVR